ncbi:MAG: polysaccharide biosynthesis tyrosine autokinase [Planctomycetota bacterium]
MPISTAPPTAAHQALASFDDEQDATQSALKGAVRFVALLKRKRNLLGLFVLASVGLGLTYYSLAPRSYESVAGVMVIQQTPEQMGSVAEQLGAESVMASQEELVRSAKVVEAAIRALPPEHRVDLVGVPQNEWVDAITRRLSASSKRKTNHMEVRYRSLHPEAAAAVVTAVIDSYLQFVAASHRTGAADMLELLERERQQLQGELATKQQQLQQFRKRIGHLAVRQSDGVVEPMIGRAIHFNQALIEAQQRRIELQASQAGVEQAIARGEDLRRHLSVLEEAVGKQMVLAALGMSQQDGELLFKQQNKLLETEAELRRISPYLGPNHPNVQALAQQAGAIRQYVSSYHSHAGSRFESMTNAELGPLLRNMLAQSVSQASMKEQQLARSFESARAEAVRQSGDMASMQMLQREVERIERQHDVLFEKIKSVDILQVQAPIRVQPVEDPKPADRPASPQLRNALALSTFAGFLLGALVVYAQDLLDDRFGSPDEMAAQLGVKVLSLVRQLQPTGGEAIDAVAMHAGGDDAELEAFRTLRTSLTLTGDVADRLVVSSAEPSDGKTTISSNLAVSFAQVGKRTLVIDGDLRRPGMTALMQLKGKPGVTDLLVSDGNVSELAEKVVLSSGLDGLDIIPAGPRRPDPAELLASKNFADLLAWADSKYDQVLIDCPPVLAVSDAQIVGRLVDGVVLVVSPEKNHRRLVARACDSFRAAGVNLFGVVANRISQSAGDGYGYGYGYGYSYGHGEEEDADEQETTDVIASDWDELTGAAADKKRPAA